MANYITPGDGITEEGNGWIAQLSEPIFIEIDTSPSGINWSNYNNNDYEIRINTTGQTEQIVDIPDEELATGYAEIDMSSLYGVTSEFAATYYFTLLEWEVGNNGQTSATPNMLGSITIQFREDITNQPPDGRTFTYMPYVTSISSIVGNRINVNQSWNQFLTRVNPPSIRLLATDTFTVASIIHKTNDVRDLNTFLHFGDDNKLLITNVKQDSKTFEE